MRGQSATGALGGFGAGRRVATCLAGEEQAASVKAATDRTSRPQAQVRADLTLVGPAQEAARSSAQAALVPWADGAAAADPW